MGKTLFSIVLIVLGLAVALVPIRFIEDNPYGGGIFEADAVFEDVVTEDFLDMVGFLKKYPHYSDLDAEQLTRRLHAHFFSETPYEAYRRSFLKGTPQKVVQTTTHGDPIGIRGSMESITPTDTAAKAVFAMDAINHGLVTVTHRRTAVRYLYALILGIALCVAGVTVLLTGRKKPQV